MVFKLKMKRLARHNRTPKRVRHPTDWLFASSCSPPHLAATQWLSATEFMAHSDTDFHRVDKVPSQAHRSQTQFGNAFTQRSALQDTDGFPNRVFLSATHLVFSNRLIYISYFNGSDSFCHLLLLPYFIFFLIKMIKFQWVIIFYRAKTKTVRTIDTSYFKYNRKIILSSIRTQIIVTIVKLEFFNSRTFAYDFITNAMCDFFKHLILNE